MCELVLKLSKFTKWQLFSIKSGSGWIKSIILSENTFHFTYFLKRDHSLNIYQPHYRCSVTFKSKTWKNKIAAMAVYRSFLLSYAKRSQNSNYCLSMSQNWVKIFSLSDRKIGLRNTEREAKLVVFVMETEKALYFKKLNEAISYVFFSFSS